MFELLEHRIFQKIENILSSIGIFASKCAELKSCTDRIQEILLLPDSDHFSNSAKKQNLEEKEREEELCEIEKVTATHTGTEVIALEDISMSIPNGKLTGIVTVNLP